MLTLRKIRENTSILDFSRSYLANLTRNSSILNVLSGLLNFWEKYRLLCFLPLHSALQQMKFFCLLFSDTVISSFWVFKGHSIKTIIINILSKTCKSNFESLYKKNVQVQQNHLFMYSRGPYQILLFLCICLELRFPVCCTQCEIRIIEKFTKVANRSSKFNLYESTCNVKVECNKNILMLNIQFFSLFQVMEITF